MLDRMDGSDVYDWWVINDTFEGIRVFHWSECLIIKQAKSKNDILVRAATDPSWKKQIINKYNFHTFVCNVYIIIK